MEEYILLIDTEDSKGLVYNISKVLFANNLNIEQNAEYVDPDTKKFFMRSIVSGKVSKNMLLKELTEVLPDGASIKLNKKEKKELAKVEEKKIEEKKREEKKVEEKKKIENESIAGLAPEHISPVAGTVDISKDKQIQFRWDKVKPATHYVVKISEAGKKTKTLLNEKVTNNSYTLKNFSKFSEGTFLWDVTPYDKKNSPGKTARGKFTIDLSNDGLKNLKPEEIKILSPDTIYRDK